MSGFKDDVISILRDNVMLHGEAMGLILGDSIDSFALLMELESRRFPVANRSDKHVFLFDYVVINWEAANMHTLLRAFTLVNKLGLIILRVVGTKSTFDKRYTSLFGDFTVHKLTYGDRTYLVIKNGVDYGN